MASKTSALWRSLQSYQIYGANTNVGKTIMSTIFCKAFAAKNPDKNIWYLKPVSTGPLEEADDRHVTRFSPKTKTKCLYQFDEAVSPHIAAGSRKPISDANIQDKVLEYLASCSQQGSGVLLLETAGGVHSPTPNGSSQADLFRPLRLPICLVTDHCLGGISASISAFESLHIRGYDLDVVLQFENAKYQNHDYLREYFNKKGISALSLPRPPPKEEDENEDFEVLSEYYDKMSKLDIVAETLQGLSEKHLQRVASLEEMSTKAHKSIWYPFTQHRDVSPESIMTIDSASGDFFQTHTTSREITVDTPVLTPTFDGSGSWWTQGLGHGSPELSLASAYAAGRYGHVMFAGTIHLPALKLAEKLLQNLRNPRLSRVFYSDNGSTGMEVAMKMALTASCDRYKWDIKKGDIGVLGLKGSYHGDTIGAMDCSEPSTFNEKVHWYKGRGYWFDFPQVKMVGGTWLVESPQGMEEEFGATTEYASLDQVFDLKTRSKSSAAGKYTSYILETLDRLVNKEGETFGSLIMEPVILGAGGMLFADPLFQHILTQVVRENSDLFGSYSYTATPKEGAWTGLPVIFDEVFTGLYRLGRFSSGSFIQIHPDISVHAKLLTGGLVPLCTTLASESIYDAFLGVEKRDALLHGHSYTAHPVGCHVANTSLDMMLAMDRDGDWKSFKDDWKEEESGSETDSPTRVWSVWSKEFVTRISNHKGVESVIALGSVLAINLQDDNAGYSSKAAIGLQKLLIQGSNDFKIHVRVLGNVLYLMASQKSKQGTLQRIEAFLLCTLG